MPQLEPKDIYSIFREYMIKICVTPVLVNYKVYKLWIQPYISVPAQELHCRAAPSVRGYHHRSVWSNHREKSGRKVFHIHAVTFTFLLHFT